MGSAVSNLPPGFVLDSTPSDLPQGFVLDNPDPGWYQTMKEMAQSGVHDMKQGAGQMADAFRFAASGAGRNLREDTPNNRVAGAYDALEGRSTPLSEGEYEGARSKSVNDLTRGYLNAVGGAGEFLGSPLNAASRVYAGKPLENATGIPKELTELAIGLALPTKLPRRPAAPSIKELEDAYLAVRNSPEIKTATVPMGEIAKAAAKAEQELLAAGHRPTTGSAPRTFNEIEGLTPKAPPGPTPQQRLQAEMNWETLPEPPKIKEAPVDDLLAAKRAFGEIAGERKPFPGGPTPDAKASSQVIGKLDNIIEDAAPGMREANANYSAAQSAKALDKRIAKAEMAADVNNSGMNIGNKIRQQAMQIYQNPAATRGLRPEELDAIKSVAEGTATRNTLRYVSNLFGGGGGLGAVVTGDVASRSPLGAWGALTAPLGFALKTIENKLTVRAAKNVSEQIRNRSPLGIAIQSSSDKWYEAYQAASTARTSASMSKFLIASRNLSNTLKDAGISVSPNELLKSLQGPMTGRAEDEQP